MTSPCLVLLLAAAIVDARAVLPVGRGRTQRRTALQGALPLLALRGGATSDASSQLYWVRRLGNESETAPLQVVRSLEAFCKEHELDEEQMRAVARGESEEHEGWQCGTALQYDPPAAPAPAEDVITAEEVPAPKRSKRKKEHESYMDDV